MALNFILPSECTQRLFFSASLSLAWLVISAVAFIFSKLCSFPFKRRAPPTCVFILALGNYFCASPPRHWTAEYPRRGSKSVFSFNNVSIKMRISSVSIVRAGFLSPANEEGCRVPRHLTMNFLFVRFWFLHSFCWEENVITMCNLIIAHRFLKMTKIWWALLAPWNHRCRYLRIRQNLSKLRAHKKLCSSLTA